MKSFRILRHSIQQITGNPRAALILSVPVLVAVIVMRGTTFAGPAATKEGMMPAMDAYFLFIRLITVLALVLLAVNWHRYVLLEEPVSLRPRGVRMGVYVLRGMQIGLLMLMATVMISIAISAALGMSGALFLDPKELSIGMALFKVVSLVIGVVVGVWMYALTMRLAVMLPAAAIGVKLGVRQALERTRGTTGMMVMLVILIGLLAIVLSIPLIAMKFADWFAIVAVSDFVLDWFMAVLSISVLTTLYGHYVEGRPLN